jgi:hypothetical protein
MARPHQMYRLGSIGTVDSDEWPHAISFAMSSPMACSALYESSASTRPMTLSHGYNKLRPPITRSAGVQGNHDFNPEDKAYVKSAILAGAALILVGTAVLLAFLLFFFVRSVCCCRNKVRIRIHLVSRDDRPGSAGFGKWKT